MLKVNHSGKVYITPRLKATHTDFEQVHSNEDNQPSNSYVQSYNAICRATGETHTITILDTSCSFYKKDPNLASTLFIQEMLYLTSRFREKIKIEYSEFYENMIVLVTKRHEVLSQAVSKHPKDQFDVAKLIEGIATDLNYIQTKAETLNFTIQLNNISRFAYSNEYFLINWASGAEHDLIDKTESMCAQNFEDLRRLQTAKQIFELGLLSLQLMDVDSQEWQDLGNIKSSSIYNAALEAIMKNVESKNQSPQIQSILRKMLQKTPETRGTFCDLIMQLNNKVTDEIPLSLKEMLLLESQVKSQIICIMSVFFIIPLEII